MPPQYRPAASNKPIAAIWTYILAAETTLSWATYAREGIRPPEELFVELDNTLLVRGLPPRSIPHNQNLAIRARRMIEKFKGPAGPGKLKKHRTISLNQLDQVRALPVKSVRKPKMKAGIGHANGKEEDDATHPCICPDVKTPGFPRALLQGGRGPVIPDNGGIKGLV